MSAARIVATVVNGHRVAVIAAPGEHVEKPPLDTAEWTDAWMGFLASMRRATKTEGA